MQVASHATVINLPAGPQMMGQRRALLLCRNAVGAASCVVTRPARCVSFNEKGAPQCLFFFFPLRWIGDGLLCFYVGLCGAPCLSSRLMVKRAGENKDVAIKRAQFKQFDKDTSRGILCSNGQV